MRLPGLWVGLLTACQAGTPPVRTAAEESARLFPEPKLGLHLLEDLPPGEPRRDVDRAPVEWLRHPWANPAGTLFPAPTAAGAATEEESPRLEPAARSAAPRFVSARSERPEPEPFSPAVLPEPRDAISRFGRAYVDAFEGLDKFEFRTFLDRYSPVPPGPEDVLGRVPPVEPGFEASAYLSDRLRRTFTGPLHEGLEGATQLEPVVEGIEDIPQGGLSAVGSVVGALRDDEDGLNLGRLRLRTGGGLLRDPARFLSLSYKLGPLRAELYPTRVKVGISRRFGGVRVSLRGEMPFTEGDPAAKVEVSRTFGNSWRFRAMAGHNVGFFSLPFLTLPPEVEEENAGVGALGLVEYRF